MSPRPPIPTSAPTGHPVEKSHSFDKPSSGQYVDREANPHFNYSNAQALPVQTTSNTSRRKQEAETMTDDGRMGFQGSSQSHVQCQTSVSFGSTSLEPPITCGSLRELDWAELLNNLLLRHDLNFDSKIQYRPNTRGSRGKQRATQMRRYWDAVRREISMYLVYWLRRPLLPSSSFHGGSAPCPRDRAARRPMLLRIPLMLRAVRDTLKSLAPACDSHAIDARVDVELLVQELENGIFDFISLSAWLATLLRSLCSPERYPLIAKMTSMIESGVQRADAELIVNGLQCLFSILETMKLDLANHQIRCFRLVTVDDTVHYEQMDFLRRIAEGWDPSEAHTWLESCLANQKPKEEPSSRLFTFIQAATDTITSNSDYLPPTFTLDYIRLRTLQIDFQTLTYQKICRRIFQTAVRALNWDVLIPRRSYDNLFARITVIASDDGFNHKYTQKDEYVALEIVREAYNVCKCPSTPALNHVNLVVHQLRNYCDRKSKVLDFEDLENELATELRLTVEREVKVIRDLTPAQIVNHYQPEKPTNSGSNINHAQLEMLRIAQQIAHIIVLHWRVWAPILYEQPVDKAFQR